MALYARVEAGVLIERRELDTIPEHKAHLWKPIVFEGSGDTEIVSFEEDRILVTLTNKVPQNVTPYQARVAINNVGLREQVETIVAQADQATRDAWEYGISIDRHSPMIEALAGAVGLTSEQIDNLFIEASKVV